MHMSAEILEGMSDVGLACLIELLDTDGDERLRRRVEYLREHSQWILDEELGGDGDEGSSQS